MTKRLSPIEMMVDQATGHKPLVGMPRGWVNLRCPKCKRVIRAASDRTDPPNTITVEAPCPKCDNPGDRPETMYFDLQDQQIHPATGKRFKQRR